MSDFEIQELIDGMPEEIYAKLLEEVEATGLTEIEVVRSILDLDEPDSDEPEPDGGDCFSCAEAFQEVYDAMPTELRPVVNELAEAMGMTPQEASAFLLMLVIE